ncbi:50S ribosomal protein L13 [Candidatus Gottesmanbacteria bacterium]|nr:50S ribosomal protein L13 [Candidatus Gottesmanbacteria bacterium]
MKYTKPTLASDIQRSWHLVDVNGKILGRIAGNIAVILIGKEKPYYVPNLDCGDYVVVINAQKIEVTGKKASNKTYEKYSGFPGGRKVKTFQQLKQENPTRIVREAVSGMLPKNKLRSEMLKRLYIYADVHHPYGAKFQS